MDDPRELGNKYFFERKYEQALDCYSEAIVSNYAALISCPAPFHHGMINFHAPKPLNYIKYCAEALLGVPQGLGIERSVLPHIGGPHVDLGGDGA